MLCNASCVRILASVLLLFCTTVTFAACSAKQQSAKPSVSDSLTEDTRNGRAVFAAQCAACHGPGGQGGGIGPSLHNERSRKDLAQTQAWIMNPQPPMPKLYPVKLSAKDVRDVAAYVQSL